MLALKASQSQVSGVINRDSRPAGSHGASNPVAKVVIIVVEVPERGVVSPPGRRVVPGRHACVPLRCGPDAHKTREQERIVSKPPSTTKVRSGDSYGKYMQSAALVAGSKCAAVQNTKTVELIVAVQHNVMRVDVGRMSSS